MIAAAAPAPKTTSAHEPPNARTSAGSASDAVIDATDVYRVASSTIHQSTAMTTEASGAITRATPTVVATILPPRRKPRNRGRQWPTRAPLPATTAPELPPTASPSAAATDPLPMSSSATAKNILNPACRQTFAAPVPLLPTSRMSFPVKNLESQYPHGRLPSTYPATPKIAIDRRLTSRF